MVSGAGIAFGCVAFPDPTSTGVISVKRLDAGEVIVGYEVS